MEIQAPRNPVKSNIVNTVSELTLDVRIKKTISC